MRQRVGRMSEQQVIAWFDQTVTGLGRNLRVYEQYRTGAALKEIRAHLRAGAALCEGLDAQSKQL